MLNGELGKETPLNESCGKWHDYVGMTLDYSVDGEVQIDMSEYIKMILSDVPPKMIGHATTPAASHLFQVNDNPINLDDECKENFIHYVMQLFYASQQGRPDIHTTVSFLCGWLKSPDADDYKKLIRVMKYLQSTVDLVLTLSSENGKQIQWWVDVSYGVHPNMCGHTSATMTLRKGSVYSTSAKQ